MAPGGRHASIALVVLGAASLVATATARADCIDDAAQHHQVNAQVLRAIGWHESRLQAGAVGHNRNGTVDLGAFQINSIHLQDLARFGIGPQSLADGCVSAYVAAWHYRHQVDLYGNSWAAVGAYHSRTPARNAWYSNQIVAILMRWNVLPADASLFAPQFTPAPRQSIAHSSVDTPDSNDVHAHARAKKMCRVAGNANGGVGDAAAGMTRSDGRATSTKGPDPDPGSGSGSGAGAGVRPLSPPVPTLQSPSGARDDVDSFSTLAYLSPAR